MRTRNETLKAFLDGYCLAYVDSEVKRRKSFFDRAGLDEDQKAAVVKDDAHNLVVAAAGSGKTRALTARIALLIERGVPPERILALAYTRTAADEMEARLASQYGIDDVGVMTLHSFCREVAKRSPDFKSGVATQREQSQFIRLAAEKLASEDRAFAVKLLGFAVELNEAEEKQRQEFPSAREYYDYLRQQEYETLTLQRVKSRAECEIGNFLFLHGVKFKYEAQAVWADRSLAFRDYQPDFFLPDYNVWIEHWAVDRNGEVPDWFSSGGAVSPSKRYRDGMEWKRGQFKKRDQKLIETFHYQWAEGSLIAELRRQLELNGVPLSEVTMGEILRRIDEAIRRDPLYELMFSFVSKAKTNGLGIADVESRLADGNGKWSKKQRRFASLMLPIWREYEAQLKDNNMLDFNDMMNIAVGVARKEGRELSKRYSHVLIDEFQDITDPQLELVQRLTSGTNGEGVHLFCVGDHRQNVFSYAGSNVRNILEFETKFPYPEKTALSTNYRCPSNIVAASNSIMAESGFKERPVVAASSEVFPIHLIEKTDNSRYEEWEFNSAKALLMQLLEKKRPDEEILVLARYNFRYEELRVAFPNHLEARLRFASIHGAKGSEADYVLLLGCIGGTFGFPSAILEDDLLDTVNKRSRDKNERLEEERRLFYVAITRCKKHLYLFTSRSDRSQFLSDIDELGRTLTGGYCIRSRDRMAFNTKEPLCPECLRKWNKYRNRAYAERYCHSCGEEARTNFAKPLCIACWRKSKSN